MLTLLIVLLILLSIGALPNLGPLQHDLGYAPSSLATIVLVVIIVLLLTGRL